jgi:hypothetical protein
MAQSAASSFCKLYSQPVQPWQPNTYYSVFDHVINGGVLYYAQAAGTSNPTGGPTGTAGTITDGSTLSWVWGLLTVNPVTQSAFTNYPSWATSTAYALATIVNNGGKLFTLVSPGKYVFTVSGVTVTPTAGAIYTNNSQTLTVLSTSISGGSGTITCSISTSGTPTTGSSTLVKTSGTGDATISYSGYTSVTTSSGGPSGTSNSIVDGGLTWSYYGSATQNAPNYDMPLFTFGTSIPSGLTNVYTPRNDINAQAMSATVQSQGTGYSINDVLTLSGGTSTTAATFQVLGVTSTGQVTIVGLVSSGSYQVLPSTPTPVTGGTGSGCTLTVRFTDPPWLRLRGSFRTGIFGIGILGSSSTFQIGSPGTSQQLPRCTWMDFVTDAPKLYLVHGASTNARYNLTIDNMDGKGAVPFAFYPVPYIATGAAYSTFDFTTTTGRRPRRWRVKSIGLWQISGYGLSTNDQSFPIYDDTVTTAVIIGDSIWNGSNFGPHKVGGTTMMILAEAMGWTNPWDMSTGGTGVINRGTAPGVTTDCFAYRVLQAFSAGPNLIGQNTGPNIWLIESSTNDGSYSSAQITAAALDLFRLIRGTTVAWQPSTAYSLSQIVVNGGNLYLVTVAGTSAGSGGPTGTSAGIVDSGVTWNFLGFAGKSSSAPIVLIGTWSINDTSYPTKTAQIESAWVSAQTSLNDPYQSFYIPIRNKPYIPLITGTWNNTNNTSSTNASVYINTTDAVHPFDLGTWLYAKDIEVELRANIYPQIK